MSFKPGIQENSVGKTKQILKERTAKAVNDSIAEGDQKITVLK